MTLREQYLPIIIKLTKRIDAASYEWVSTHSASARHQYDALVQEMNEIKSAIVASEV